ncbi:MAG TPA: hypothetical protein VEA37_02615 [Flavobacterium sp.]|nr:hypothetical protein [Flavobacterium sp.]
METKFGPKQINNPTPNWISNFIDFIVGVLGVVSAFLTTAAFIPQNVSDITSSIISGLATPILLYIKRYFGVTTGSTIVHIDDVTGIKES